MVSPKLSMIFEIQTHVYACNALTNLVAVVVSKAEVPVSLRVGCLSFVHMLKQDVNQVWIGNVGENVNNL